MCAKPKALWRAAFSCMRADKLKSHVSPHDTCNTIRTAQCLLRLERLVTRRWPSPSMTSFKNMTYTLPYIMFIYKYHTRKCVWDWHSHSRRSPAHRQKSMFSEDTTSNRGKTHNRDTSGYLQFVLAFVMVFCFNDIAGSLSRVSRDAYLIYIYIYHVYVYIMLSRHYYSFWRMSLMAMASVLWQDAPSARSTERYGLCCMCRGVIHVSWACTSAKNMTPPRKKVTLFAGCA